VAEGKDLETTPVLLRPPNQEVDHEMPKYGMPQHLGVAVPSSAVRRILLVGTMIGGLFSPHNRVCAEGPRAASAERGPWPRCSAR
jgi:hypothetical protein